MSSQELIDRLLSIADPAARFAWLQAHASELDDRVAEGLKERANQYLRSDIQRSLDVSRIIGQLAEVSDSPMHLALGIIAEANARAIGLGQYTQALSLYDHAADLYHAYGRPVDQIRAQVGKIWPLTNLGRHAEVFRIAADATSELERREEWILLGILSINMGNINGRLGEDRRALEFFERALAALHKAGPAGKNDLPLVKQNMAIIQRNLGQFDLSIQTSQRALKLMNDLGQSVEAARALQNLAITYFTLGQYNEALKLLNQAREIFLSDGRQRDAILVELFISDCLLQMRRFGDVLGKCAQVRTLFSELGAQIEVAQAILNEAIAYAELGRYAEALASLSEARTIFEAQRNEVWVASVTLETAAVLLRQGRYAEALSHAEECITTFAAHGFLLKETQAKLILARAALPLRRIDLATFMAEQVHEVGVSRNVPLLTYQGYYLLGTLAAARGDADYAIDLYDCAIVELERLRGRLMVEFRADFLEDKQSVYEDAVQLCIELERPSQALEYAERAKSRALIDLLAYKLDLSIQPRKPGDQQLVDELVRLRNERNRIYRRWEARNEAREEGWQILLEDQQSTQQHMFELEQQMTQLWHSLLVRNADYARDAAVWQVRAETAQPYLPAQALLVEYFIAHGELQVFLVDGQEVQVRALPGALARVQQLIRLLWLNLKTTPRSDPSRGGALAANIRGLLGQLYGLLVAPLEDRLREYQQLIIVPHGQLHYLPFHALYDGQRYLVERHEISYLPGSSMLRYVSETRRPAEGVVVFGHSCGGALPNTLEEARSIAATLGAPLFLEEQATLSNVTQLASQARLLHLAAHGEFRPDNPLFSGLALDDGWLTTLELFNLRLECSLVTLSACQTGRNVVGGGDELLGMMRGLLYAGAASVVLSLWAVEDRSTALLMQSFYRKLAAGCSKGAALRQAQLECLYSPAEAGYAHPYFWAPFVLVGDSGKL